MSVVAECVLLFICNKQSTQKKNSFSCYLLTVRIYRAIAFILLLLFQLSVTVYYCANVFQFIIFSFRILYFLFVNLFSGLMDIISVVCGTWNYFSLPNWQVQEINKQKQKEKENNKVRRILSSDQGKNNIENLWMWLYIVTMFQWKS